MVVTEVSVKYEVLFVVAALGSPYCSCWLQLLVLLMIVPTGCHFVGRDLFCYMWPSLDFVYNH